MIKILILNINKNPLSAAPPKCVRYLAPLITHVFLCVSSFLQKLFVSWLLHATHSLCASLRSFKSVRTLSRVPRSDRKPFT